MLLAAEAERDGADDDIRDDDCDGDANDRDDGRDGDEPSGLLQSLWEKMWELACLTCPKGRIVKALRHVQHKFPDIYEIERAINLAPYAHYYH